MSVSIYLSIYLPVLYVCFWNYDICLSVCVSVRAKTACISSVCVRQDSTTRWRSAGTRAAHDEPDSFTASQRAVLLSAVAGREGFAAAAADDDDDDVRFRTALAEVAAQRRRIGADGMAAAPWSDS